MDEKTNKQKQTDQLVTELEWPAPPTEWVRPIGPLLGTRSWQFEQNQKRAKPPKAAADA